ncbi:hypothetical protein BC332_02669 [Capsicum chinense]|nr:hypothetical protein BC332_02669 [Capsicum chinense]
MPFFLTLRSVQTLSDPKVIDRIKKELFEATIITRKIILEGGLVVADGVSGDGVVVGVSGSGAAVGVNDASLTVFETTNRYDYDHIGFTNFAPLSECSACKCFSILAGLPWHLVDEVYIPINCSDEFHWVLVVVVLKERCIRVYDSMLGRRRYEIQKLYKILPTYLDISGFLDHRSMIEAYRDKMGNPFDVEYVEEISQQPIDCGLFVATYFEYLSDGLQVSKDRLDAILLLKIYATLLWKYGEAKAQKPHVSGIKDPQ